MYIFRNIETEDILLLIVLLLNVNINILKS